MGFRFKLGRKGFYGEWKSSITSHNITWTFDEVYLCWQFAMDDWGVAKNPATGKVVVSSVSPAPTGSGSSYRNGSMVNPAQNTEQGYDGRDYYNASLSVAFPLDLYPNQSLISTKSTTSASDSNVLDASILTCLDSVPSQLCFRPQYWGSTKTLYPYSGFRTDLLRNLDPNIDGGHPIPNVDTFIGMLRYPWIDHLTSLSGWCRKIHPDNNMPNYGRDICNYSGGAALLVHCNIDSAKKLILAKGLTQIGIDSYYLINATRDHFKWHVDHTTGRYIPILFAGYMLDNDTFKNVASLSSLRMAERDMTHYGTGNQYWAGWQNTGHSYASDVVFKYEDPDSGDAAMNWEDHALTLWNELPAPWKHTHAEGNVPWDQGEGYRRDASGVLIPVGLAARLIPGLKTKFSADHFFSYVDRWIYEDGSYTGGYAEKITELVAAATADDWTNGAHLPNHLDPKYADYICYAPQGTDYGIMSGWALAMYLYYRATYPGS